MNEHDWAQKYYQGAVGFTITAACMSADGFPANSNPSRRDFKLARLRWGAVGCAA
tara:strand:+ start:203 stop:367 length:165 start_codon:yes stop_codon:yes gene_type:complete